jgi:hypothetical protein
VFSKKVLTITKVFISIPKEITRIAAGIIGTAVAVVVRYTTTLRLDESRRIGDTLSEVSIHNSTTIPCTKCYKFQMFQQIKACVFLCRAPGMQSPSVIQYAPKRQIDSEWSLL